MAAPSPVNRNQTQKSHKVDQFEISTLKLRNQTQKSHPLQSYEVVRFCGLQRNTMPTPHVNTFKMRAIRTDTGAFVTWTVQGGTADSTGAGSGLSPLILEDIVITEIY